MPIHPPEVLLTTRRQMLRRGSRALAALSGVAALGPVLAAPRRLPDDRPIEWIVGYPPGGGTDLLARTLAAPMSAHLGVPIAVVNRPGAATAIAAESLRNTRNPQHTVLTGDLATLAANPSLYPALRYEPQTDFRALGLMARFPMVLVVGEGVPARDWPSLRDWVSRQPDGVAYASAGAGSPHHLSGALLGRLARLDLVHVAYKGAAPALQDVAAGVVPMMLVDTAALRAVMPTDRLRIIGVASPRAVDLLPNVPTLAEQGLTGFEAWAWQGLVAHHSLTDERSGVLHEALQHALAQPEVAERLRTLGLEATPGTAQEMARYTASERVRWAAVIDEAAIRLE